MRTQQRPFLTVLSLIAGLAGASFAVAASTAGCGSKTDEGNVTPAPDTGLALADSSVKDTAPVDTGSAMDTEKQYDVPGSLFDVTVPDIQFEGGKSVGGCLACTTDKCKKEVEACDKDVKCRGLVLCGLTECEGNFSDFGCLLGCASKFDVMLSAGDPTISKALAVGNCVQKECVDACPLPAGDGGMMSDTKPADASDAVASDGDASAFMIFPKGSQEFDPDVARQLSDMLTTLGGMPVTRAQIINQYSDPH
jgi:hypothetical protein